MNKLHPRILAYVLLVYIPVFTLFNLLRLWGYGFGLVDLGIFHQIIFNFCNGDLFQTSIKYPFAANSSWLGFHFIVLPIVLAAPFYYLFPQPETLEVLHVLLCSLTSIIIYKTCIKLKTGSGWACFWAVVYLFNPITLYHVLFSFEEASFATPLMALGLYFVVSRKFTGLLITSFLLVLTKEHLGISVAGFGCLWALYNGKSARRQGLVLFLFGIASFLAVVFLIIPHFSPYHEHFMLSAASDVNNYNRYQWLTGSFTEVLSLLPEKIFNQLNIQYLLYLLLPLLLLPLGTFMFLLPLGGDVLISLLSDFPAQKSWHLYYSAPLVPALIIASAITLQKMRGKKSMAGALVIINALLVIWLTQPLITQLSLFKNPRMDWNNGVQYQKAMSVVPKDAWLLVDEFSAVPVSGRRKLSGMEPELYSKADYVLLRISPYRYGPFYENLNAIVLDYAESFANSPDWGLVYWQYPYAVFKRGAADSANESEMKDIVTRYRAIGTQKRKK